MTTRPTVSVLASLRRRALIAAAPAAAALVATRSGWAQTGPYPNKRVRLLVGFAPGGIVDVLARLLADRLQRSMGQPFVVEHRPGAGGNLSTVLLARAKGDPYTLQLGSSGPLAGRADADALVQAVSGLADITGEPGGPPVLSGFPIAEGMAALVAASGIIAALRERTLSGRGQALEVALYDCAFSTYVAFMPFPLTGQAVTRAGNRHVSSAPWNLYQASDGRLVICTGTDEQWLRLCELMARPDLAADASLRKARDRVAQAQRVDEAVSRWAATLPAAELDALLGAENIPAGPILAADALADEPNLRHRGLVRASANGCVVASAVRHFPDVDTPKPPTAPARSRVPVRAGPGEPAHDALPFAGLRVIELGQFTTAPLVARHLGALGAEVIKVESPSGDASRPWNPQRDGQSFFFTLSNSDKRSVCLDLRKAADLAQFRSLVAAADVFVENLKPGSLARLGLAPADLAALNPRLVYCAISGFGADSAYPGRPAFDTVCQAMSGMMDLIRYAGEPQKAGISLADVLAGLFGLIGTNAALFARDATGAGAQLDIAMQDAAAWMTQWRPAAGAAGATTRMLRCSDGYAVAAGKDGAGALDEVQARSQSRAEFVATASAAGMAAAPVHSINEVAASAQVQARQLLVDTQDACGRNWPAFASPIRLGRTRLRIRSAVGRLGEANASLAGSQD